MFDSGSNTLCYQNIYLHKTATVIRREDKPLPAIAALSPGNGAYSVARHHSGPEAFLTSISNGSVFFLHCLVSAGYESWLYRMILRIPSCCPRAKAIPSAASFRIFGSHVTYSVTDSSAVIRFSFKVIVAWAKGQSVLCLALVRVSPSSKI
jgi:hypothetical protein